MSTAQCISVIVPAYNATATIGAQVRALVGQAYDGPWELLVVDNRSTDDTVAVAQAAAGEWPHLQIISAPQRAGAGYARNVGAAAARGAFLAFCDADDVAAPGWLAAMAAALAEHPFVCGPLDDVSLNGSGAWVPPAITTLQPTLDFLPHAPGGNFAITRSAFAAVNGFDESFGLGEDIDLSWRLQLAGYPLAAAPGAVMQIRHRQSAGALWRQFVAYSTVDALLFRTFRTRGMPRSSLRRSLRRYRWLITNAPKAAIRPSELRTFWVYRAAACWGRVKGSLRYRTIYL